MISCVAMRNRCAGACRTHLEHGTTSLMATVSTADNAAFVRAMAAIEQARADTPQIAGIHIEGPYFAMAQRGAQSPRFIRDPDPAEYKAIAERFACIRRWSAAPELPRRAGDGALHDCAR